MKPKYLFLALLLSACQQAQRPVSLPVPTAPSAFEALITDTDLRPLAGVQLTLFHPLARKMSYLTDQQGLVSLTGLEEGQNYLLELSSPGWLPQKRLIQRSSPGRLRLFMQAAAQELKGQIRNQEGQGLAGAVISTPESASVSDAQGYYQLALQTPASASASKQGYQACQLQQADCQLKRLAEPLRLRLASHLQPLGMSAEASLKQLSALQATTRELGYRWQDWQGLSDPLNPETDILWLLAPSEALLAQESQQIREFVAAGGKLIVSSEWAGFPQANLNGLLAGFGLQTGTDSLQQQGAFLSIQLFIADHPLLAGVSELRLYRSSSLQIIDPQQAQALVFSPAESFRILSAGGGQSILAASLSGKGKVIVLGDSSLWLEADSDGNGVANYLEASNARLWRNILGW